MDATIYIAHALFWGAFFLSRCVFKPRDRKDTQPPVALGAGHDATAPFSKSLIFVHILAFAAMNWGIGLGAFSGHNPHWIPAQRIVGFLVIGVGGVLVSWAIANFHSWRFRAQLTEGHELATGGPFKFLRHPIYMGLNLLALGSLIWIPNLMVGAGFVLMVLGGELRARAEEKLLYQAYGEAYRQYCERTARFVPGIY